MHWGAIFDFDGVVVDSAHHHELCWQKVAKEYEVALTHEQFLAGFGVKNERFIAEILGWTEDAEKIEEIAKRKEALFQEHIKTTKIECIPGIGAFLQKLEHEHIPSVIASSSIVKNIELVLSNTDIASFFSHIVSGEDVKRGKPDPQCFLEAAKRMQLPPERTVVFEDALLGVEAAKRAGAFCVALTTTFSREEFVKLPHKADMIVKNFEKIDFAVIDSWFH